MSCREPLNLGDKVGKWTLLEDVTKKSPDAKFRRYLCRCECGNEKEVDASSLRKGLSKSCGCNRKIRPATSAFKPAYLHSDAQEQFELIAKGCLPPADAFSVAEGIPCWNLRSIAEILGIQNDQLVFMLKKRSRIIPISKSIVNDFNLLT